MTILSNAILMNIIKVNLLQGIEADGIVGDREGHIKERVHRSKVKERIESIKGSAQNHAVFSIHAISMRRTKHEIMNITAFREAFSF